MLLGIDPPSPEDIAAYVYALLAPSAYQRRFAAALETPGLRVPITASRELWIWAVAAGRRLLWLHTYAERFVDPAEGRPPRVPQVPGIGWERAVTVIPETPSDVGYDEDSGSVIVGDGRIGGVRREVWDFAVSGMQVVPKWLGYRTRRGAGRAVSSTSALDHIRPTEWADEWNDELLDLLRILTLTVEAEAQLATNGVRAPIANKRSPAATTCRTFHPLPGIASGALREGQRRAGPGAGGGLAAHGGAGDYGDHRPFPGAPSRSGSGACPGPPIARRHRAR